MKVCYNTDKLYLLEIMVNRLCIDYEKLTFGASNIRKMKQVVVLCKFQDFPVLEIREEEFCQVRENYDAQNEVVFKSGKSCLFSARSLAQNLDFFMIHVQVARELVDKNSGLVVIGSTCVQLDCHFVEVLKSGGYQNSRSMEETYPLYSRENCCIGNISLCVRLSVLGNMILTSVKGGKGNEPFAVKGEGVTLEHGGMAGFSTYGRLLGGADPPYPQQLGSQQQRQHGMYLGPANQMYNSFQTANMGPVNQGYGSAQNLNLNPANQMIGPARTAMMGPVYPIYGNVPNLMQALVQDTQQQQSTQARPNLPFCGHIPIRSLSYSCEKEPPPPAPQWLTDMFCSCDYPLPPGFDKPPRPQPKKKKKKKKDKNPYPLELKGNYCLKPNYPMGYPALPGFDQGGKTTCTQFPLQGRAIGLSNNPMFQSHNLYMGPNAVTLSN